MNLQDIKEKIERLIDAFGAEHEIVFIADCSSIGEGTVLCIDREEQAQDSPISFVFRPASER